MNPDELDQVSRRLEAVRFEPRASLGAEVMGRWRRGDAPADRPAPMRYLAFAGVALGLALGVLGLWRLVLRPPDVLTVDRCCFDIDGGGAADDGLLVAARRGSQVKRLAVYEDRDGNRSFSPGDVVRFLRQGEPAVAGPLVPGTRTVELCCLDYDGGGLSDDALVIVGLPPDRITMAAIYERLPSGRPAVLR